MDINSPEFKENLEKTIKFTDKIVKQFGFEYNPNHEITEGIQLGLTRNKMIHGKRFCPCFLVTNTKEDRICPCKPALQDEIPNKGICHCTIFCTPEKAKEIRLEMQTEEDAHAHKNTLTKDECDFLLKKQDLDGDELQSLMEAREAGVVSFVLIDIREKFEYDSQRIKGTDELYPTSTFFNDVKKYEQYKDKNIVLYCRSGSRTHQVKFILRNDLGFDKVSHITHGIISYPGELE
jgi:ferredoxin-thioredoxin reductase catalytic subunit/rhodanese-related sulfurtransferase